MHKGRPAAAWKLRSPYGTNAGRTRLNITRDVEGFARLELQLDEGHLTLSLYGTELRQLIEQLQLCELDDRTLYADGYDPLTLEVAS